MSYLEIKTEGIPSSIYCYSDYPDVGVYAPEEESLYVIIYRSSGLQTGMTVPKAGLKEIEFDEPAQPEQVIKANDIATILAVALHKDAAEKFVSK